MMTLSTLGPFVAVVVGTLGSISSAVRVGDQDSDLSADFVENVISSSGECGEKRMEGICVCEKKSPKKLGAYQCSACLNTNGWGYGCDLPCPEGCPGGCDMSGNCLYNAEAKEYANCKRNGRAEDPTDLTVNSRGECIACVNGNYGLLCDQQCPAGCADSAEGICSRAGSCYECKTGFFGMKCDEKCPQACPNCLMEETELDGEILPAGSCAQPCEANTWGRECKKPCPENCETGKKVARCRRDTGQCKQCKENKFWGPECRKACPDNCKDGTCDFEDGTCTNKCNKGYWGSHCQKECPAGSVAAKGCNRDTGLPKECEETMFPAMHEMKRDTGEIGVCAPCPENCADQKCHQDGLCKVGCKEGFFGEKCEKRCSASCAGGCDQSSGQCNGCPDGLTGKFCSHHCHASCNTCQQFGSAGAMGLGGASAGNTENDCLSCRSGNEPAKFMQKPAPKAGTCDCIDGSERDKSSGHCKCKHPDGNSQKWEGYYDASEAMCRHGCRSNYVDKSGKVTALQKVIGTGMRTDCIPMKVYNGFVLAYVQAEEDFSKLVENTKAGCEAGKLGMKDGSGDLNCVFEDQVKYIVGITVE